MKDLNLVDYHVHTARCGHAEGRLEDYAARALEIGLVELGFSDHMPLLHTRDETLSMGLEEFPLYVREVEELRGRYRGPHIRLGIEVDYLPQTASRLHALLDAHLIDGGRGARIGHAKRSENGLRRHAAKIAEPSVVIAKPAFGAEAICNSGYRITRRFGPATAQALAMTGWGATFAVPEK